VARKDDVSDGFRAWLAHRIATSVHVTPNQVALEAEVDQSQLSKILRGKERATDSVLAKIGPPLGIKPEQMILLATADRLGGSSIFEGALDGFVLLIDELESYLHPGGQDRLKAELVASARAAQAGAIAKFPQRGRRRGNYTKADFDNARDGGAIGAGEEVEGEPT
jgi:transcriptional regulator with XRE-family HTH domain